MLIVTSSKMEEVCQFVKEYIKGNSLESDISYIDVGENEDFATLIEERDYILEALNRIEEVSAITNVLEGPFNSHLADLVVADHMIVKISIHVYTNSRSYDYWVVELETIIF